MEGTPYASRCVIELEPKQFETLKRKGEVTESMRMSFAKDAPKVTMTIRVKP
jgi:hypothetical protein